MRARRGGVGTTALTLVLAAIVGGCAGRTYATVRVP